MTAEVCEHGAGVFLCNMCAGAQQNFDQLMAQPAPAAAAS